MTRKLFAVMTVVACSWAGSADARPPYINNPGNGEALATAAKTFAGDNGCAFCHVNPGGGGDGPNRPNLNVLGQEVLDQQWFNSANGNSDWEAIGGGDPDGDTFTTAIELMANPPSDPRDANSTPAPDPAPDMGMDMAADMADTDMGGDVDMGGDTDMGGGDVDMGGDTDMGVVNPPADMGGVNPPADMGGGVNPPADMSTSTPAPTPEPEDEGSCAVSSPVEPASGSAGLLALLGLVLGFRRRQR